MKRSYRHSCRKKQQVTDPYTNRCVTLSMSGIPFDFYVIPYITGNKAFLNKFSDRDKETFLKFMKRHHLLPKTQHFHHVREYRDNNAKKRSSSKSRLIPPPKKKKPHIASAPIPKVADASGLLDGSVESSLFVGPPHSSSPLPHDSRAPVPFSFPLDGRIETSLFVPAPHPSPPLAHDSRVLFPFSVDESDSITSFDDTVGSTLSLGPLKFEKDDDT